jgi:hypothetical protein
MSRPGGAREARRPALWTGARSITVLGECGVGDDVVTVGGDGVVRMRDRVIPGVDAAALRRQAQDAAHAAWRRVQGWDPLGGDQPVVVSAGDRLTLTSSPSSARTSATTPAGVNSVPYGPGNTMDGSPAISRAPPSRSLKRASASV